MFTHKLKVFAGRANPELAEKVAIALRDPLGKLSLSNYPDGEIAVRIDEDVRGRDVFVLQPTCPPVNDNLLELLVLVDCLKRASAARINAVLPYYGYARQDRKDVGRVPITAKLIANLLTTAGVDRVIALDLHAAQIQGFFDIPVDHLHASPVINDYVRQLEIPPREVVVLSPDEGNVKRVLKYQKKLGAGIAIVDKRRVSGSEVKQVNLIGGPLDGKIAIIFDDMISTGNSVVGAARVAKQFGAREVYACVTHPVLCGPAVELIGEAHAAGVLKQVVVTDSIPLSPLARALPCIKVLTIAPLLAEAISRVHGNESLSVLFE